MQITKAAEATPYALKRMAAYQRKDAPSRAALIAAAARIEELECEIAGHDAEWKRIACAAGL